MDRVLEIPERQLLRLFAVEGTQEFFGACVRALHFALEGVQALPGLIFIEFPFPFGLHEGHEFTFRDLR